SDGSGDSLGSECGRWLCQRYLQTILFVRHLCRLLQHLSADQRGDGGDNPTCSRQLGLIERGSFVHFKQRPRRSFDDGWIDGHGCSVVSTARRAAMATDFSIHSQSVSTGG